MFALLSHTQNGSVNSIYETNLLKRF